MSASELAVPRFDGGVHTTQSMERRVYTRELKIRAVRRVQRGTPLRQVAHDFGISSALIARWQRELQGDPVNAFRGHGQRKQLEDRVELLRRENERLKVEKDFLKKALARFASNRSKLSSSLQSIERYGRFVGCARYSMSRQADITTG